MMTKQERIDELEKELAAAKQEMEDTEGELAQAEEDLEAANDDLRKLRAAFAEFDAAVEPFVDFTNALPGYLPGWARLVVSGHENLNVQDAPAVAELYLLRDAYKKLERLL